MFEESEEHLHHFQCELANQDQYKLEEKQQIIIYTTPGKEIQSS